MDQIFVWRNFEEIVTLEKAQKKQGKYLNPEDLSSLKKASVVFNKSKILWVGKDDELPEEFVSLPFKDYSGHVLTPELIDSHTHLVFGGDRAFEYSLRLNGADYEEIAVKGGGILHTRKGTLSLSKEDLFELGKKRIEKMASYGVGTIEIKSGYALEFEKEYELSHIINDLKKNFFPRIQIKNTFMAAHAVPKEFESSSSYLSDVVLPLLDKLGKEKILDAVDIFHEKNYFNENDVRKLFLKAKEYALPVKIHADEFYDNSGAQIACEFKALSADHLLATSEEGINFLANSETIATLLPGTGLFLGKKQADGRKFLDKGVRVALASDFNPGSCHFDNLLLIASIAGPLYKMNLCELWASITLNAAKSLGIENQGAIREGLSPRFSIFKTFSLDHITYNWSENFFCPDERFI